MADPLRVLYVMGYGRSGSTVLDTVLGNLPGVESVGELVNVVRAAWRGDERCACGERAATCPYWSAVRRRWEECGGDVDRYLSLQKRYESRSAWLRLFRERAPRGAFDDWARMTTALCHAVAAERGARVVVDSSKWPIRALALHHAPGIDLFAIHLVRDGRGVAWSLARPFARNPEAGVQRDLPARSIARTALSWSFVNYQAEHVLRRLAPDRRAFVRYEDYVEDLGAVLAPLADFLGADVRPVVEAVAAGEPLTVGHTVAGNRLRMAEAIRLRANLDWKEHMPAGQKRRFWRIAGPRMKRYGYAR